MSNDEFDPDFMLRDLLTTLRDVRRQTIDELTSRHRVDGVSDFGLMKALVITDASIAALEKGLADD